MKGQWIGNYEGTNTGTIVVNVDDRKTHFEGHAFLIATPGGPPITHAVLKTPDQSSPFEFEPSFFYVDPNTEQFITPPDLATRYPGFIFPTSAKAKGSWTDDELSVEWTSNIGTTGSAKLKRSAAGNPSEYKAQECSWPEFKSLVGALEPRRCIFRGQESTWRLRTSFHRTRRADLIRFMTEDIPALYRVLSGRTRHIYDLANPDQNGAFYHLAQHHGYPTPLLDWSYSPFVAAFCAFRKVDPRIQSSSASKVRMFVFDQEEWRATFEQIRNLTTFKQHFSVTEFVSFDNERMVPQQALSCVSNVDDIESYIRAREAEKSKTFLRVFDLPASERQAVMKELSVMGITAGSMFPGLDGSCEEIKERLFYQ